MTTVYLVRHAHADLGPDEARSLSTTGRQSARVVAERLAGRPVRAIYASPSRRAIDTVTPLAERLRIMPTLVDDLRERALPIVASDRFQAAARQSWDAPDAAPPGGETNHDAQARGLAAVRSLIVRHAGEEIVVSTHGTLLALILNGLDPSYDYDFWCRLTFPDIYAAVLVEGGLTRVERVERVWVEE